MNDSGISDQGQIAALLSSVQRHQLPVHLLAPAASAPEPSLLLAENFRDRQLLFDAPRDPDSGLYQSGSDITVLTVRQGAELRFDAKIIGTETFRGYPALRTTWPTNIISRQRRKAFRVRIGDDSSSRLELYDDTGRLVRGRLTDLSLSGFGALLDLDAPLRAGEDVESSLEIDSVSLTTSIRISDLRVPTKGRFMRVGAAFTELSPQQQAQLERLIRALERRAIRTDGPRS